MLLYSCRLQAKKSAMHFSLASFVPLRWCELACFRADELSVKPGMCLLSPDSCADPVLPRHTERHSSQTRNKRPRIYLLGTCVYTQMSIYLFKAFLACVAAETSFVIPADAGYFYLIQAPYPESSLSKLLDFFPPWKAEDKPSWNDPWHYTVL